MSGEKPKPFSGYNDTFVTATEAEQGVVGCVMMDASMLHRIGDRITGRDFLDAERGQQFDALRMLHEAGKPVHDIAYLSGELPRLGVPVSLCSFGEISRLCHMPVVSNAVLYAEQIARASQLRKLVLIGDEIQKRAKDPSAEPSEVIAWIEAKSAMIGATEPHSSMLLADIARQTVSSYLEESTAPTKSGAYYGIHGIDDLKGPLLPSELEILAGRPGNGKTAMGMQVAEYNARQGLETLFVSLEMKDRELVARLLCKASGVNGRDLRGGHVDSHDLSLLADAAEETQGVPLRVYAPPRATLADIRGEARHVKATHGLKLLVVDYIGRIRPSREQSRTPRHEIVQSFAEGLKSLAKELDVPVLALAQLNRDGDEEPKLIHLRESGAIEQEADSVVLLHHPDASPTSTATRQAFAIVAKHRHGMSAHVEMAWQPVRTQFSDPEPYGHAAIHAYNQAESR